ncbi:MAG: ATP-binding cassette domain-containing protein, partial [Cyanobacteria bacterium J06597_16]
MAQKHMIEIHHLDHYFGQGQLKTQVLFDIHLAIEPGEIVFMTGPSGSGKTTLLTLISGLRSVQSGSLRVLDQELFGATKREQVMRLKNIAIVTTGQNL